MEYIDGNEDVSIYRLYADVEVLITGQLIFHVKKLERKDVPKIDDKLPTDSSFVIRV